MSSPIFLGGSRFIGHQPESLPRWRLDDCDVASHVDARRQVDLHGAQAQQLLNAIHPGTERRVPLHAADTGKRMRHNCRASGAGGAPLRAVGHQVVGDLDEPGPGDAPLHRAATDQAMILGHGIRGRLAG